MLSLSSNTLPNVSLASLVDSGSSHSFIDLTFINIHHLLTHGIPPIKLLLLNCGPATFFLHLWEVYATLYSPIQWWWPLFWLHLQSRGLFRTLLEWQMSIIVGLKSDHSKTIQYKICTLSLFHNWGYVPIANLWQNDILGGNCSEPSDSVVDDTYRKESWVTWSLEIVCTSFNELHNHPNGRLSETHARDLTHAHYLGVCTALPELRGRTLLIFWDFGYGMKLFAGMKSFAGMRRVR